VHAGTLSPAASSRARAAYNYVEGDILTVANTARQIVARPRLSLDPYSCGVPGLLARQGTATTPTWWVLAVRARRTRVRTVPAPVPDSRGSLRWPMQRV